MKKRSWAEMEEGSVPQEPREGPWSGFWRQFRKNRLATAGLVIFILFFLLALAGRLLTMGEHPILDPALVRLPEKLRPPLSFPSRDVLRPEEVPRLGIYLLGTDDLGRDLFARMLQGAWVSLTVGFVAVGISVAIGVLLGGVAGYYGHRPVRLWHLLLAVLLGGIPLAHAQWGWGGVGIWALALGVLVAVRLGASGRNGMGARLVLAPLFSVDALITGLIDIMLCFPSFFLILTVVALLPSSIYNIMAVIGLTSWMGAARFVRAEFLSLREQDFVSAARALGLSDRRIIFRHMVPNAVGPVLVSATIGIAGAILTESGLSFLGFGVPPPHATWGNILADGRKFLFDAPWLTLIPGLAILVVVLAFNLFGEGLRDVLNPRLRERLP
jgi:peptide/nickel transport system permease protein